MKAKLPIYNEERFRTPVSLERELGLWVDRIGRSQADSHVPDRYRRLGQYAAVSVEAGAGKLETTGQGARDVAPGDVIMLSPGDACRYYPINKWDTRWVVWNGPEAAVLERMGGRKQSGAVVRGGSQAVLVAWQRLSALMDRQDPESILGRKVALLELIRELSILSQSGDGQGSTFLDRAVVSLGKDPGAPEPISVVASRMNLSAAHFRRLFKAATGTSPKSFQAVQRITRAKELMAEGVSIKETAEVLGFVDVFHFMRLFRRVTGQTAGQFAAVYSSRKSATHAPQA